jgi:hypothetical protein
VPGLAALVASVLSHDCRAVEKNSAREAKWRHNQQSHRGPVQKRGAAHVARWPLHIKTTESPCASPVPFLVSISRRYFVLPRWAGGPRGGPTASCRPTPIPPPRLLRAAPLGAQDNLKTRKPSG